MSEDKNYKFAIIGYPVAHSLSKYMHEAALKALGLSGSYDVFETKSEDLVNKLKYLKTGGYLGFNVTIPHKIPITLFLSEVDEVANLAGSVNTVLIDANKNLKGYNTDVYGFMEPIKELDLKNKKAIILGTGGASRAAICGLSLKGISKIDIYTRNVIDTTESISIIRKRFPEIEIKLLQYEIMSGLSDASIIVNTTPLGMKGFRQGISPLSDEDIKSINDNAVVYDIVYNPIKTELVNKAAEFGKKYITGIDMLVFQGARAFEIWTGIKPNLDKMKIAALEELVK